ncbi:MAG TPA: extracellular solute-binding protein [Mycobacteriales bacterium]|nr:extracellular solute-binding protein [Mycobacteriales bacterium]
MRQLSRRRMLQGAAAGLLAAGGLGAAGCAPSARKTIDGKPVLNLWTWDRNGRGPWHEKAWQLYKKAKKPDFELELLYLPFQQMHDKILIAAEAGSGGPDISDIEISTFGRFIRGDPIFVELTPELQRQKLLDKLYRPSATDPWSYKNKVYGLGNELNTCLMCYRWDVYEKAKVTTPITSWDQFAEEARRFHKDTGNYLMDVEYLDWQEWWQLTLQQGGGFFDEKGNPTIDSPEGRRTLDYRLTALKEGWSFLRSSETGSPQQFTALGAGQVATIIGPPWYFAGNTQNYIPDTKGKWRLQAFPQWDKGGSRTATHGGTGTCVLKSCPLRDQAVDYVIWSHTNVESVLFDYKNRQTFPTYRPAYAEPALTEPVPFFDNQRVGKLIQEVSPDINRWYNSPFWPNATDTTVREGITPALSKGVAPKDALSKAQRDTLDVIDFSS